MNTILPDEERKSVHDVMNFFSCDAEVAKTILQSSQLNGQLNHIKKICHDNIQRKGKQ